MARAKTMTLQGNEYAKVAERIKLFREDNPKGLIETTPTYLDGGKVEFAARILKNKADPNSGEGTGHSFGDNKNAKAYEKLETIAVGRALAMLGYMASGEIASDEEMQEFEVYKAQKVEDAITDLKACKTIEELKTCFKSLGSLMANKTVFDAKNAKKEELSNENN